MADGAVYFAEDVCGTGSCEPPAGLDGAALDALESADAATDAVFRDAYACIAEDERRHAELAFQFVRWALERGGPEVRERLTKAVEARPSHLAGARAVTVP